MPHKLLALAMIFGTIALMVAWIPCMDAASRMCRGLHWFFGHVERAKGAVEKKKEAPARS